MYFKFQLRRILSKSSQSWADLHQSKTDLIMILLETSPFVFVDIAMKQTAVQSSTNFNGFASRAVDGNFKYTFADKSCTHTKDEANPWWRVDLGKEHIITGRIYSSLFVHELS